MGSRWETMGTVRDFILGGSKITTDGDCSHKIKKTLAPWKKSYDKPRQHIKKQRHDFVNKSPSNQSYGFFNSHLWMWELDQRLRTEELMLLNCGVGEDSWESLGLQGDQTSQSWKSINQGIQSWTFIGRADAEAEDPILWPPDGKSWTH